MSPHAKPYILTFTNSRTYLHVCVSCDKITREIALAYLAEVAEACAALGCRRLLIERNVPTMLPLMDLVDVTKQFLEMVRGIKVAFYNPHLKIHDEMDFAVLYGRNRGGSYSLHNSLDEAERWLLSDGVPIDPRRVNFGSGTVSPSFFADKTPTE